MNANVIAGQVHIVWHVEGGRVTEIEKIQPSLPEGSKPSGNYADASKRTYKRQNEATDLFASNGYKVEMLDEIPGGNGYGLKDQSGFSNWG